MASLEEKVDIEMKNIFIVLEELEKKKDKHNNSFTTPERFSKVQGKETHITGD